MAALDNLFTNSTKVASTNLFNIDQVIYSNTSTFSATNTPGVQSTFTLNSGIGQYGRPVGIYSTDGGTTWSDFSGPTTFTSSFVNSYIPVAVGVTPEVSTSGVITYLVQCNSSIGGGGTFSIIISVALLESDAPSSLSSLPNTIAGTNKIAMSSITPTGLQVSYRQILKADTQAVPGVSSSNTQTVPHNLGYVPDIVWWMIGPTEGTFISQMVFNAATGHGQGFFGVGLDATNVYLYDVAGVVGYQYVYRLYKP